MRHNYAVVNPNKPYADGHFPVQNIIVVDDADLASGKWQIPNDGRLYLDLGCPYDAGQNYLPVPVGGTYDPTTGNFYRMDDSTLIVGQTVPVPPPVTP